MIDGELLKSLVATHINQNHSKSECFKGDEYFEIKQFIKTVQEQTVANPKLKSMWERCHIRTIY